MKQDLEQGRFRSVIRELTKPLNDQYPRPWMTKLADPFPGRRVHCRKEPADGVPNERRFA